MPHSQQRFLPAICGLFTVILCVSNTLDTKIFSMFSLALPAGIILFPLSYVFGDVLTEVYGYAASRKVIWTGLVALIVMVASYELARALPPANFWKEQASFDAVLSHVPRLVLASILAYFCGEFCNSYVVAKMKIRSQGKRMALRFVASTIAGQAVDTSVFVLVAFGGVFAIGELISITISAWAVKVGWEIVALPLTLNVTGWLKRAESEDYFDTNTNFNPFRVTG